MFGELNAASILTLEPVPTVDLEAVCRCNRSVERKMRALGDPKLRREGPCETQADDDVQTDVTLEADWRDTATSQGTQRAPQQEEARTGPLLDPQP